MSEQIMIPPAKPISVAVTTFGTQAVMHFSEPREFTAFSAKEALMVGQRLILSAIEADSSAAQAAIATSLALVDGIYEMRGDLKPAGGAAKHELIERHRRTLTRRLEVMLNTLRERKKTSTPELAKQMVEAMLKEVFA